MAFLCKPNSEGIVDTDNCELLYTYTGPNGNVMDTETARSDDGAVSWTRTYSYDDLGNLLRRSKWVQQ